MKVSAKEINGLVANKQNTTTSTNIFVFNSISNLKNGLTIIQKYFKGMRFLMRYSVG